MNKKKLFIQFIIIVSLFAALSAKDNKDSSSPRTSGLFNTDWRFQIGDIQDGQNPDLNDSGWRLLDLPHDWSIEGKGTSELEENDDTEFRVVRGKWKFNEGDNMLWKNPEFIDSSWQVVTLPATWDENSNYTPDNVFGWYRRELFVPAELEGQDIFLNLGKIDDTDETFFNGVKVGGMGTMPPNYTSAWDIFRYYKVPKELIKYGENNIIAVRVFDGVQGGGIYIEGEKVVEGIFDASCPGGSGAGFVNGGIGWYRKTFTLDKNQKGKRVFIEFDGIYMNSDVWINGFHLGNRPYGYSSFQYELTKHLKYDKENVIAVRVNVEQPCSRWYSGAGIYRNVRLTITDPIHIAHWGTYITTPEVSESSATIRVETKICNQSAYEHVVELKNVIVDDSGDIIASGSSSQMIEANSLKVFEQVLEVKNPKLWSVENPVIYDVKSEVSVDDEVVDNFDTPFGVRTFEFTTDKGFFLNGKHVDLNGVCLHHDLGSLGAAVNKRAIEHQLEIMKTMGCNAIRTSHNPPAPELLDLCDRMGFLVMDEAFDEWIRSKTKYGYGQFFEEWSERDLADMIRRDKNHPSIIMWSIGNEIPEQDNDNAYEMVKRLADICFREDPTRPVTSACNSPEDAVKTGFNKALDVFGINYNMFFYDTYKGRASMIGSETTSAVTTRGEYNFVLENGKVVVKNDLNNQCSSYNDTTAETTLKKIKKSPWVAGQFLWTGFDYIGEPSPFSWPSVSSYFGIVDLCGFPKDRYYLYQSQWTDTPIVHLLPHWNMPTGQDGFEGKEIPVWCYSNCESVELFLNGKSLGEKKFSNTEDLHLTWNVPYVPGTLKAVAKKNGKVICVDEIKTAGEPAKINLIPDRNEITADGQDLSFVKVEILDKEGNICPNADNLISFSTEGEGTIAGVGNGNPISHEDFKANKRKAFHGLALVIIKSTLNEGEIKLHAVSDNLKEMVIKLKTKKLL